MLSFPRGAMTRASELDKDNEGVVRHVSHVQSRSCARDSVRIRYFIERPDQISAQGTARISRYAPRSKVGRARGWAPR